MFIPVERIVIEVQGNSTMPIEQIELVRFSALFLSSAILIKYSFILLLTISLYESKPLAFFGSYSKDSIAIRETLPAL